ncbi:MAG: CAP domain-containing protein [Lachnospiraceae bacterium]|nr:CAP domain-containing protein [Lachnospiraceae bacterium]
MNKRSKKERKFHTGSFYAFVILLLSSISLFGCNGKGENGANGTEIAVLESGYKFEGDQGQPSSAATEDSKSKEAAKGDSSGNTANDSQNKLTSQELLNSTPTKTPTEAASKNIPSNIEVIRTGDGNTNVPSYSNATAPEPTPAVPVSMTPVVNGVGIRPEYLTIYLGDINTVTNPTTTPASGTGTPTPTPTATATATPTSSPNSLPSVVSWKGDVNATITNGSGNLTWRSSDPNVAFVTGSGNQATITGVSEGLANVEARLNGSVYGTVVVKVFERAPNSFDVDACQVNAAGEYSVSNCDSLISKVNEIRKSYNIAEAKKNSSLCKAADIRAKEIAFVFGNFRPNLDSFNSVAPKYYKAEAIACIPASASVNEAMAGLQNYTTTRADIMNENYNNIGASYYKLGDLVYVVLAFGY